MLVKASAVSEGPLSEIKFLANHIQKILACNGLQHVVQSWRIACTLLEIYLYSPKLRGKKHLQNGTNLWLAWSKGVMESPVPKTWQVSAYILIVNIFKQSSQLRTSFSS